MQDVNQIRKDFPMLNGKKMSGQPLVYLDNAATTFISNGIPRPVASAALGHEDPSSLDYYTFADIKHLRDCALSIGKFPVRKGVFEV